MNIQNEIYRRLKMHELLLHSNTGTPEELAQKLHVSKRQLYNLVDEFRAMGASINIAEKVKHIIIQMTRNAIFQPRKLNFEGKNIVI